MAYDAESDRAILFNTDGQTWAYDFDTDTWTHRAPKSPPPARTWYAITYDQGLDRVVVFGGEAAGILVIPGRTTTTLTPGRRCHRPRAHLPGTIRQWHTIPPRVEQSSLAARRVGKGWRSPYAIRGPMTWRRIPGRTHLQRAQVQGGGTLWLLMRTSAKSCSSAAGRIETTFRTTYGYLTRAPMPGRTLPEGLLRA